MLFDYNSETIKVNIDNYTYTKCCPIALHIGLLGTIHRSTHSLIQIIHTYHQQLHTYHPYTTHTHRHTHTLCLAASRILALFLDCDFKPLLLGVLLFTNVAWMISSVLVSNRV